MVFIIVAMIALTVYAAFRLARDGAPREVIYSAVPDRPCAFGYGMAWLAIRARSAREVIEALRLFEPVPCNWNSGIGAVYDARLGASHVFVSPPVGDWTFVVGLPLPHPMGRGFVDKCTPLLVDLGGRFPEVQ